MSRKPVVVIGGYGPGLGKGLAVRFAEAGYHVVTLSRRGTEYPGALNLTCDLTDEAQVTDSIAIIQAKYGAVDVYIHNVFALHIGGFLETGPNSFEDMWRAIVLSAVHASHQVLPDMVAKGSGVILFSGATAALRGGGQFSAFAAAKFALRGLAQSLAREFQPKGVHVAHIVLDGLMYGTASIDRFGGSFETALHPEDIAGQYLNLAQQPKSCWSQELDLRPQSESF